MSGSDGRPASGPVTGQTGSSRVQRGGDPQALDEGVLLAQHAATLQIRNRIEVATLGEGRDYAAADYEDAAREALELLAQEQEVVADRLAAERASVRFRFGPADSQHDYRRGDRKNLRLREQAARKLAARLRERAQDPAYCEALIESARGDAWRDVAGEIRRQLRVRESPPAVPDAAREARIADFAAALVAELAAAAPPPPPAVAPSPPPSLHEN